MLKTLILKNLILVDSVEISFDEGLTVITGETGSGKTALLEAIKFLLGERGDASKVRKGSEKALIQGEFDISKNPMISFLLEEQGIVCDQEDLCLITREIHSNGKSRSFIAGQLVSLHVLQKIAPYLVEIVDQHAHVLLRNEENQRSLVDLFAGLSHSLHNFQRAWTEEKNLLEKLEKQKEAHRQSEQRKITLEESLDELISSNIQKGEDETLFKEYTYLANIQDLLERGSLTLEGLSVILPQIFQLQNFLKEMHRYDSSLEETYHSLKEIHIHLDEIHLSLQSKFGKMETDPHRLQTVDERLKLIDKLKKKYGLDLPLVRAQFEKDILELEDLHFTIDQTAKELEQAKKKTNLAVEKLTGERIQGGQKLASILSQSLKQLNIPDAKVEIRIEKCPRTNYGEDRLSFYLQANAGEQSIPVKENASGGELARLLFCLKIALADKNNAPIIVFDEIDANVGGKTADRMGKKLVELGNHKQVLCITHFPQVAKHGNHHFSIIKTGDEGRTITKIERLDEGKKQLELLRMLGEDAVHLQNR